jgi:PAS domain S-box-containing protein
VPSLHLLLLEDNPNDAELVQALLQENQFACEITLVQTREGFLEALRMPQIELILADYRLPSFDGLSALHLAQQHRPDVPFIFVSGVLGEEVAVDALRIGATDYVLKTRLSRLVPAVERALREARERSERARAEDALRRNEMYLAEAQVLSHTGSFGWDVASGELYWSDETYRMFEVDRSVRPSTQLVIERTHPDDRARLRAVLERAELDRKAFAVEHRLALPSGAVKDVYVVARGTECDSIFSFVGAVTDVTERKRSEQTLREQASLLDLTHDAIFVRDMDGRITYWNRGAEALYGWSAQEATGKLAADLLNTASLVPLERILETLRESGHWEGELVRMTKARAYVTVASRWSLQCNAQGVPVAALETNNDITLRKRAEQERERLRQLESDLAHINRVSMMGEMAASLAHEVKQPMAAAAMNASACMQWLRRAVPDIAQADGAAAAAAAALKRAIDIINGVYSLYTQSPSVRQCLDVNDIIREMTFLLHETAKRNSIGIRTELDPTLRKTSADPVQLQQVLLNLMMNAIEAMRENGGEIVITSEWAEEGDDLVISVIDAGVGLPPGCSERVFDAFFTTKENGTGMGLCICRRIVEAHGGRLIAIPNAGPGATFRFTVPAEPAASTS